MDQNHPHEHSSHHDEPIPTDPAATATEDVDNSSAGLSEEVDRLARLVTQARARLRTLRPTLPPLWASESQFPFLQEFIASGVDDWIQEERRTIQERMHASEREAEVIAEAWANIIRIGWALLNESEAFLSRGETDAGVARARVPLLEAAQEMEESLARHGTIVEDYDQHEAESFTDFVRGLDQALSRYIEAGDARLGRQERQRRFGIRQAEPRFAVTGLVHEEELISMSDADFEDLATRVRDGRIDLYTIGRGSAIESDFYTDSSSDNSSEENSSESSDGEGDLVIELSYEGELSLERGFSRWIW